MSVFAYTHMLHVWNLYRHTCICIIHTCIYAPYTKQHYLYIILRVVQSIYLEGYSVSLHTEEIHYLIYLCERENSHAFLPTPNACRPQSLGWALRTQSRSALRRTGTPRLTSTSLGAHRRKLELTTQHTKVLRNCLIIVLTARPDPCPYAILSGGCIEFNPLQESIMI